MKNCEIKHFSTVMPPIISKKYYRSAAFPFILQVGRGCAQTRKTSPKSMQIHQARQAAGIVNFKVNET